MVSWHHKHRKPLRKDSYSATFTYKAMNVEIKLIECYFVLIFNDFYTYVELPSRTSCQIPLATCRPRMNNYTCQWITLVPARKLFRLRVIDWTSYIQSLVSRESALFLIRFSHRQVSWCTMFTQMGIWHHYHISDRLHSIDLHEYASNCRAGNPPSNYCPHGCDVY